MAIAFAGNILKRRSIPAAPPVKRLAAITFTLPQNDGELLACVHHSLAECYARTLRALERMLRTTFRRLCIVGGGSQNAFLNELTAKACGLPISAGQTEGTALGNLLSQMLASGEISDIGAARGLIRASFDLLEI